MQSARPPYCSQSHLDLIPTLSITSPFVMGFTLHSLKTVFSFGQTQMTQKGLAFKI